MVSFEDLIHGNYNHLEEWLLDFHGWFNGLPLINQILTVILLVLITVGVLVLVYYILKGVFYLIYYLFKGLYYLLKFIFWDIPAAIFGINKKEKNKDMQKGLSNTTKIEPQIPMSEFKNMANPNQNTMQMSQQNPIQNNSENTYRVVEKSIPSSALPKRIHCPMCGVEFTEEMTDVLRNNKKVFCEYCGHGLEYVLN